MSAQSAPSPQCKEVLRTLLVQAAREGRVDLGSMGCPNWAAIDGFLLDVSVSPEDLSTLSRADINLVHERVGAPATSRERIEAAIEWLDESGLASALIIVAIIIGLLKLWLSMLTPVHATTAVSGPEPSDLAGLLVALAPAAIAVALMACATRGQASPADDEAFGDTTGFGEGER